MAPNAKRKIAKIWELFQSQVLATNPGILGKVRAKFQRLEIRAETQRPKRDKEIKIAQAASKAEMSKFSARNGSPETSGKCHFNFTPQKWGDPSLTRV